MNLLAIAMLSRKKLNTYSVESPCKRLPGVGSFLANPGLSKEQLVPSCTMRASIMEYTFMEIMAQCLRRCVVTTFIMADISIEILALFTIYLFVYWHQLYYKMHVSTP